MQDRALLVQGTVLLVLSTSAPSMIRSFLTFAAE